jgi:CheY-like chemotaxis protein
VALLAADCGIADGFLSNDLKPSVSRHPLRVKLVGMGAPMSIAYLPPGAVRRPIYCRAATILVVDDSPDCRAGLELLLRRQGFQVLLAADGQQALECIRAGVMLDLILLDMLLPVVDGFTFLERLQTAQTKEPVPIIIMTGMALGKEWAWEHGCAGFVKKPIDKFGLFEEVRRCLIRRRNEARPALPTGAQTPASPDGWGAGSKSH